MSQDCWGPGPEDYKRAAEREREHQAHLGATIDELESMLPAAFAGHRSLTMDRLRAGLKVDDMSIRDSAFRRMLWALLSEGTLRADLHWRLSYHP